MAKRDKKARFAANIGSDKVPKQPEAAVALGEKNAKITDPAIEGRPLAWRFSGRDGGGPYSWETLSEPSKFKAVLERLHEFETKQWSEIIDAGCHPIPKGQLCRDAQRRLSEIERDDLDELMSFRISGPERVWAIREQNIMRVLWWDPEHKVYPVEKDKADRRKRRNRR